MLGTCIAYIVYEYMEGIYMRMQIYNGYVFVRVCLYECVCIYVYVCMCVCIYIYIYIYTVSEVIQVDELCAPELVS